MRASEQGEAKAYWVYWDLVLPARSDLFQATDSVAAGNCCFYCGDLELLLLPCCHVIEVRKMALLSIKIK